MRMNAEYLVKDFLLEPGERIVGIRSASKGLEEAAHYSFQWVIGKKGEIA